MDKHRASIIYWDSSALLSALFQDAHSEDAVKKSRSPGIHMISSLAYSEVCAVLARLKRERLLADVLVSAAFESLDSGPWRQLSMQPDRKLLKSLAGRRSLRGAELWHLGLVLTLHEQLPEIRLLTYDSRLKKAGEAEHVSL